MCWASPRKTPCGAGLPQSRLVGDRVENGKVLGMVRHQLAPELERVLPGRVRKLVHEALEIDGVLVDVHASPESWRDVRVAHGMVNQQVRDGIPQCCLRLSR